MRLDVRTILILRHPDSRQVLLLRRSREKKLFPGLITGIGGSVELSRGEGDDLESAALRELEEETQITRAIITRPRLRLSTVLSRDDSQVILLWHTGKLLETPPELSCTEGDLAFFSARDLPIGSMIPTARAAIPFVLSLPDDDLFIYNGVFDPATMNLTTNRGVGRL